MENLTSLQTRTQNDMARFPDDRQGILAVLPFRDLPSTRAKFPLDIKSRPAIPRDLQANGTFLKAGPPEGFAHPIPSVGFPALPKPRCKETAKVFRLPGFITVPGNVVS